MDFRYYKKKNTFQEYLLSTIFPHNITRNPFTLSLHHDTPNQRHFRPNNQQTTICNWKHSKCHWSVALLIALSLYPSGLTFKIKCISLLLALYTININTHICLYRSVGSRLNWYKELRAQRCWAKTFNDVRQTTKRGLFGFKCHCCLRRVLCAASKVSGFVYIYKVCMVQMALYRYCPNLFSKRGLCNKKRGIKAYELNSVYVGVVLERASKHRKHP